MEKPLDEIVIDKVTLIDRYFDNDKSVTLEEAREALRELHAIVDEQYVILKEIMGVHERDALSAIGRMKELAYPFLLVGDGFGGSSDNKSKPWDYQLSG